MLNFLAWSGSEKEPNTLSQKPAIFYRFIWTETHLNESKYTIQTRKIFTKSVTSEVSFKGAQSARIIAEERNFGSTAGSGKLTVYVATVLGEWPGARPLYSSPNHAEVLQIATETAKVAGIDLIDKSNGK